jgi:thiopurine S-methyltransferase
MDRNFWIERWRAHEIGFHQPEFEPALDRFWPRMDIERGTRVFVPLCGKSLDMLWFAQQGYGVVGAELSEQAVDEFFAEREVSPEVRHVRDLVRGFLRAAGTRRRGCGRGL